MRQLDLLALGVLAAGGNLLGGALITRKQPVAHPKLNLLIATGAGFLLAAVCLEIIPAAMPRETGLALRPMAIFIAGYLTLFAISNLLAQHSHTPSAPEAATHSHWQDRNFARRVTAALLLHTFFDGVTIASGAAVSLELGVLLAGAALLHKVPEGIAIASVLLTAGYSRRVAQGATVLIALITLLGVLSVMVTQPPVYSLLPFTGGIAFYVAASDLIPEVRRKGGVSALLAVIAGALLFGLLHLLMRSTGLH